MFLLFLLSIFFSPSKQQGCIETQFASASKSLDQYPKPGAYCTSTEAENKWRGELIYEYLKDSTGIRVRWKHILQRSDCWGVEVKFYVNNRFTNSVSSFGHDWVEIKADKTFELKIQALYQTEPKCFEASRIINMDITGGINNKKLTFVTTFAPLLPTTFAEKTTEDSIAEDTENATAASIDTFFTEDNYKNTIIISLSSLLVIIIIVFTVIAIVMRKRIREGIMKVDDNNDVYGTYYRGEVEYSEVVDANPYYGS